MATKVPTPPPPNVQMSEVHHVRTFACVYVTMCFGISVCMGWEVGPQRSIFWKGDVWWQAKAVLVDCCRPSLLDRQLCLPWRFLLTLNRIP